MGTGSVTIRVLHAFWSADGACPLFRTVNVVHRGNKTQATRGNGFHRVSGRSVFGAGPLFPLPVHGVGTNLSVRPLFVILTAVLLLGCGEGKDAKHADMSPAVAYGKLPGLKAAPDKRLQDELARIVDEAATPELLAQSRVLDKDNAAAIFKELFEEKKVEKIFLKSEELFPKGPFTFNAISLEQAIQFRWQYEEQRLKARDALSRPGCDMGIRHDHGYSDDLSLVNVFWICSRLEAFTAAELLAEGDPTTAIEAVEYILRLAALMAAEKNATVRLQAAFMRTEALNVLQSVVNHQKTSLENLQRVHAVIREQLADWTPDSYAWIGDRALGMYAYELARDGQLGSILTPEEIEGFSEEGILFQVPAAAGREIDDDEAYYLDAMRRIIDSCEKPYHTRVELFKDIRKDLHEKRNLPEFPVIAGRLLLPNIEKGHVIQARDRANCEAWSLATALATGTEPPLVEINPLTGKPYTVRRENVIAVFDVGPGTDGDNPPVIVPILTK